MTKVNHNPTEKQVLFSIPTEVGRIDVLEPGLFENIVNPGETVTVEHMKDFKTKYHQLSEGKPFCLLVTSGYLATVSKEALALAASKDFATLALARAMIYDSVGHRVLGNVFLALNKPVTKTRLFSNREEALKWLKTVMTAYRKTNKN